MSDLVQSYQYEVPDKQARKRAYALKMVWGGLLVLGVFLAATIFVAFTDPSGVLPMLLLTVLPAALICGWASYWYRKHTFFSYDVEGLHVTFQGAEYYVPPENMAALVRSVYYAWDEMIDSPEDVYRGVQLEVVTERPIYPLDGEAVIGLTWHQYRASQIWGPYALSRGGAAYELLLHGAEYVWPLSPEGLKIERMRRYGVFDRLREAFQDHGLE